MAVASRNLLSARSQPATRPRSSRAGDDDNDVRAAPVSGNQDDDDNDVMAANAHDTRAEKPPWGQAARSTRTPSREGTPPHSLPDTSTAVALDISGIDPTPERLLSRTERDDRSASGWQPVAAPSMKPAREQATADDESAHTARGSRLNRRHPFNTSTQRLNRRLLSIWHRRSRSLEIQSRLRPRRPLMKHRLKHRPAPRPLWPP